MMFLASVQKEVFNRSHVANLHSSPLVPIALGHLVVYRFHLSMHSDDCKVVEDNDI